MVQEIGEGINGLLGLDADSLTILQISLLFAAIALPGNIQDDNSNQTTVLYLE